MEPIRSSYSFVASASTQIVCYIHRAPCLVCFLIEYGVGGRVGCPLSLLLIHINVKFLNYLTLSNFASVRLHCIWGLFLVFKLHFIQKAGVETLHGLLAKF